MAKPDRSAEEAIFALFGRSVRLFTLPSGGSQGSDQGCCPELRREGFRVQGRCTPRPSYNPQRLNSR